MNMNEELTQHHERVGITPVDKMRTYNEMFSEFRCKKKDDCRAICKENWCENQDGPKFLFSPPIKGEGDIYVSQYYQDGWYQGIKIPRIVILSLSRPQPDPSEDLPPPNNTPQEQSQGSGGDRNEHWPRTLLTVRSLLYPFISNISDEEIEQLFVHVRTAKCCSNVGGGRNEDKKVYANCGGYLRKELSILKPDAIVTQGVPAYKAAQNEALDVDDVAQRITKIKVPSIQARIVTLKENNHRTYWLPMIFPTNTYGHMNTWDKQAGTECNGVRKNLVRYGEKIKKFIDNR